MVNKRLRKEVLRIRNPVTVSQRGDIHNGNVEEYCLASKMGGLQNGDANERDNADCDPDDKLDEARDEIEARFEIKSATLYAFDYRENEGYGDDNNRNSGPAAVPLTVGPGE